MVEGRVEAGYQQQKEKHVWWAAMIWAASGLYLFYSLPEARFLSLAAVVFFLPGLLVVAYAVGSGALAAQRGVSLVLARTLGHEAPGLIVRQLVGLLGMALWIGETVLIFFLARTAVEALS